MRGLMQTCKLIRHEFRPLYLPMKYVSVTADVAKRYIATYFPDTLKLTGRVEGRVDIILDPSKASHNELFWALKLGLRIYDIDIGFSGTITNTTHHRSAWLLTAALRTFRHAWTNAARGDIVGVGLVANGTVPGIRVTFSQAGKYMLDVRGKKARPRYFASMGLVEDVGRSQGNEIYLKRW